jgi:hypothetical protein
MSATVASPSKNRRRTERRRPRSSVHVECRKGAYGFGPNIARLVLDMSESGLSMVISQELAALSEVEVTIGGYGIRKPFKRVGTIRWQVKTETGNFCVGIEFQKQLPYREWALLAAPRN